ncbi:MAG: PKD domain-containing protein [Thermoplasmata archaeon]|nr:PKD domain-containing protein [Thermoplasmata archaeon]
MGLALRILASTVVVLSVSWVGGSSPHPRAPSSGGIPSNLPPSARGEFVGWTVEGPGHPCTGGLYVLVERFTGNASGGVAPYIFDWDFADGRSPSTLQNPSHVFSGNQGPRSPTKVDLTVTDSANRSALGAVEGYPAVTSCPSMPGPFVGGFSLFVLASILVVVVATTVLVAPARRGRLRGRT